MQPGAGCRDRKGTEWKSNSETLASTQLFERNPLLHRSSERGLEIYIRNHNIRR